MLLSGPFAVIDEHLNTTLPNFYDAIGLMLMIRIIHQNQVARWGEIIRLCTLKFVWFLLKLYTKYDATGSKFTFFT